MRISVDFDGVLIEQEGIDQKPDVWSCEPKKDAVDAVRFLQSLGYECFVLTARGKGEWDKVKEWLVRWGFPEMEVTNRKMNAIVYIDDRAIRFTNWQDICKIFG